VRSRSEDPGGFHRRTDFFRAVILSRCSFAPTKTRISPRVIRRASFASTGHVLVSEVASRGANACRILKVVLTPSGCSCNGDGSRRDRVTGRSALANGSYSEVCTLVGEENIRR
jgi:hypothetical protein